MSSLFDDWSSEVPVRLPDPPAQPAAWLGSVCVWGPAQSQGSKKAFIHPHARRSNGSPVVVIVDDNDKALKSWRQELVDAMQRCKPPQVLNSPVARSRQHPALCATTSRALPDGWQPETQCSEAARIRPRHRQGCTGDIRRRTDSTLVDE
jgi:hypothetical protein